LIHRRLLVVAVLAALAAGGRVARAETRRLAVLVGNNAGDPGRLALRFAEDDVEKLGAVFSELGGLKRSDLWLLKGSTAGAVRAALAEMGERVRAWRNQPDQRAVVLFYFSGHSDGQALELGGERLSFADVRGLLAASGADVRLAFIDSCRAGGLLASKGGAPGPGFEVQLADNLSSSGEAVITSSSADESALESEEIRASFFSHHLVSGLRGAADVSGDGQVTLAEAYQYAFARTVTGTANTVVGTQHPVYDYRLSGRGDLVLTRLQRPSAIVEIPAGFDRVLLVDQRRGEVVAELGPGGARRLAVAAGRYRMQAWRQGRPFAADLALAEGDLREVPAAALLALAAAPAASKGDAPFGLASPARALWLVGGGAEGAVTRRMAALPSLRLQLSRQGRRAATLGLDLASGRHAQVRESRFELRVGLLQRWNRGAFGLGVGAEAGAGWAVQVVDGGQRLSSPVGSVAATVGGSLALGRRVSLALIGQLPARVVRRDARTALLLHPAAWVGTAVAF
jgi:hypothetical protein